MRRTDARNPAEGETRGGGRDEGKESMCRKTRTMSYEAVDDAGKARTEEKAVYQKAA